MFDVALISANAFSALAVSLMIFVIRNQSKADKRIQRVESDLYIDPKNPTSMPLTKQVADLNGRVYNLKKEMTKNNKHIEDLNGTLEKLNESVSNFVNNEVK